MLRQALTGICAALTLATCGPITITIGGTGTGILGTSGLPTGYDRLLSTTDWGFRRTVSGEPVRRGGTAERYELRDGDCAGSDCGNPWYRTEIREGDAVMTARIGHDNWYGWSFYNDTIASVSASETLGVVVGQWKSGGTAPPVIRLIQTGVGEGNLAACDATICNQTGLPTDDVVLQLESMHVAYGWGAKQNNGQICRLFGMATSKGKWVDIVVNTNFATDLNGYVRVWVNGELRCTYYGQVTADPRVRAGDLAPSVRRGIYASHPQPYVAKHPGVAKPTLIAYYDEFLEGATRGDVDPRVRESLGIRPKD